MNAGSKISQHWTDEQLIEHLYGIGPDDNHLPGCPQCRQRISAMHARRHSIEEQPGNDVGLEFLGAQRRRIYAKLDEPVRWWRIFQVRRWAAAAAALLIVGGGLIVVERPNHETKRSVSDSQLAAEVSQIADDSEPKPTAPLQALFEE